MFTFGGVRKVTLFQRKLKKVTAVVLAVLLSVPSFSLTPFIKATAASSVTIYAGKAVAANYTDLSAKEIAILSSGFMNGTGKTVSAPGVQARRPMSPLIRGLT